jgi:hypothetical protein
MTHSDQYPTDRILWLDCVGGLIVGTLVLLFCGWISELECLPIQYVVGMGVANLAYGSYSIWVTLSRPRSQRQVEILAAANTAWLFVCLAIAVLHLGSMSLLGYVHVIGEGVYVAALGITEWLMRKKLVKAKAQAD